MFQIFISHKQKDEKIINKLRDLLLSVACPEESIFYSTDPRLGIQPGAEIQNTIVDQIRVSDILLLVYTDPDLDWTYPIYETTWAMASDTRKSNVIVLSLHGHIPVILKGHKIINLTDKQEIYDFIHRITTEQEFLVPDEKIRKKIDPGYFLGMKNFDKSSKKERCDEFFEQLTEFREKEFKDVETIHRMDYLKIKIPVEIIDRINDCAKPTKAIYKEILNKSKVDKNSDKSALRYFGMNNSSKDTNLEKLFTQWQSEREKAGLKCTTEDLAWQEDFLQEIWCIAKDNISNPSHNWQKGIQPHDLDQYYQMMMVKSEKLRNGSIFIDTYINKYRDQNNKKKRKP